MSNGIRLSNGQTIPPVFLGTWDIRTQDEADTAVQAAISSGYRGIDTAACYENEEEIRRGIENSGADRNDLIVTSKLWNNAHGYDKALRAFDESEARLGRIESYLIHWPGPVPGFLEAWKALERLYREKRVQIIGVSNFMVPQLSLLLEDCEIEPMINQIECHLWYSDFPLINYCQKQNIGVQAFSPLSAGNGLLGDEGLRIIAAKYGKSPAQIALRFLAQQGICPVPKSTKETRIAENIDLFDFSIRDEDMETLKKMNRLVRTNKDPLCWFDQDYK